MEREGSMQGREMQSWPTLQPHASPTLVFAHEVPSP